MGQPAAKCRRPRSCFTPPGASLFSHQNSSSNSSSKKCRLGVVLGPFWEAFWGHFSSFFAPGAPFELKNVIFHKCVFSPSGSTISKDDSALKSTQNQPKRPPRGNFFPLKIRPRFWSDFSSILPPKWPPLGHPGATLFGIKIGLQVEAMSGCSSSCPKLALEPPRGSPKAALDLPKGRPGAPQTLPKAAPDPPKASQDCLG